MGEINSSLKWHLAVIWKEKKRRAAEKYKKNGNSQGKTKQNLVGEK